MIYAGWRGTTDLQPEYDKSDLAPVLAASGLPEFFTKTIPAILQSNGHADPDDQRLLDALFNIGGPMMRHPVALFIDKMDMANGPPMPHAALLCRAGDESAALLKEINQQLEHAGNLPVPVAASQVDDLVVVTLGYAKGELKLPTAADKASSLAGDGSFQKTLVQVDAGGAMVVYVQAEEFIALIGQAASNFGGPNGEKSWNATNEKLKLSNLKRFAWSTGFDGKQWGTRAFIAIPDGGQQEPLSDAIYAAIPQTATAAAGAHFDLKALFSMIAELTSALDPATGEQFQKFMHDTSEAAGVDIQNEFLGEFGDEWAYYTDPMTSGRGQLSIALVNHPRDAQKLAASMMKLEQALMKIVRENLHQPQIHLSFRRVQVGSLQVHYLATPFVTPAWAVADGNIYFSLYPEGVVAAAAQVSGKRKSIRDNPAFASLQKQLGKDTAADFAFSDLRAMSIDNYAGWRSVVSLAHFTDIFGTPAPPIMMPPLYTVWSHLSPAGGIDWTDAQGWHARSVTPFPARTCLRPIRAR